MASNSVSRSRGLSPMPRASCWLTSLPGYLDVHTAEHVFHALSQLVRASGLATIIATHNMDLAARLDRRVTLREGRIIEMD